MLAEAICRFWTKVDKRGEDECWPWKGARTPGGYGQMGLGLPRRKGRPQTQMATHISLAIVGKARPSKGHVAMHLCDKPWCVNPKHLQWGTNAENMADMVRKGRAKWQGGAWFEHLDPVVVAAQMDDAAAKLGRGSTKLTADLVRYIRQSSKTTLALAEELGVTNQAISSVRTGRTWKHVK